MTTDAGIQQIMAGFAPAEPGIGVEVDASLAAQVGGLAAEMRTDRRHKAAFQQAMAQAVRHVPLLSASSVAGTPATFSSEDWVCKTGYAMYVQLITAKNLGSTDTVWLYRTSASGVQQVADSAAHWLLNNANPAWSPGRTGFRVGPGDGVTVQGTTTQTVTVNIDVIMVESWIEPDFLL